MSKPIIMSTTTRNNWLVFAAVFVGAVLAMLSGIYYLFAPVGKDAVYILIPRETWDNIHLMGGVLMVAAAVIHFIIHWSWVKTTVKRVFLAMKTGQGHFSSGSRLNIIIDLVVALSFLITALSGIYFLFAPDGGYQGGRNLNWDPNFLFSRTTWDVIHTWAAVTLIVAAVPHFYIHWGWIKKVTSRFFASLLPQPPEIQSQTSDQHL
ncbi:MAG: DUF4405 domain-containing protein [Chloroflexota bacterium]